jgi:putative NADPH-quinone reductase
VQTVFDRFNAADIYLFAVPMWNAGVPWVLKHLIDTITQPSMCFGFDPSSGYTTATVPPRTSARARPPQSSIRHEPAVA